MKKNASLFFMLFLFIALFLACGCGERESESANSIVMSMTRTVTTLDPALAGDSASRSLAAAFYDTPLQYKYASGSYELEPGFLASMPTVSADGRTYTLSLRSDLYFQPGKAYAESDLSARRVTSSDLAFSILRLADARLNSPGYSLVRGRIKDLETFRAATRRAGENDMTPYDTLPEGLSIHDEKTLVITLESPDSRFNYALALPFFSVVSRLELEKNSFDITRRTAGSGPFVLTGFDGDHSLEMARYKDFREEYYKDVRLPAADRITCFFVKQPFASWLMFLQGNLDFYSIDGDNFDAVVDSEGHLAPSLSNRGITLLSAPQLETNYIGFSFTDPLLGRNVDLRRAISLAFDRRERVIQSGGKFVEAYSPIPPGVAGYLKGTGPFGVTNIERAKTYLAKAGYQDGIDPATGKALVLRFDQAGSGTFHNQTAELFARDMKKIGIEIEPSFNTRARFFEKLSKGDVQIFRMSWEGDYPDGENFMQLFYGGNAGGSNRVSYRDPIFDAMFEKILPMCDSPERTRLYEKMGSRVLEECPWICETYTRAFILTHSWLKNYIPHDFAFNRWKYLSAASTERAKMKKTFTPLDMGSLR